VIASVSGKSDSVNLTVAESNVFINVATGTTIEDDGDGRRYKKPYTVLVTDSNGTPVNEAAVTLSIYPEYYYKGYFALEDVTDSAGNVIVPAGEIAGIRCQNEDRNRDGILDPGEDVNGNGELDPGNVVTVDKLNLETIDTGYADFYVVYAKDFAMWVDVEITARARVEGSEATNTVPFYTVCSVADMNQNLCPRASPFGFADTCANPD